MDRPDRNNYSCASSVRYNATHPGLDIQQLLRFVRNEPLTLCSSNCLFRKVLCIESCICTMCVFTASPVLVSCGPQTRTGVTASVICSRSQRRNPLFDSPGPFFTLCRALDSSPVPSANRTSRPYCQNDETETRIHPHHQPVGKAAHSIAAEGVCGECSRDGVQRQ